MLILYRNDFNSGDITVLVPYSRQLGCLKERLVRTRTCSIALSNKDKEDLADMGFLDDAELQQFRSTVEVSRMVRLATIDGFQGEEAKVVILSTVRSNIQDRVGFLQTTNRVNVACTRARNGFYIVGNATLLRTVDMWSTIIDNFQSKGRIGSAFITHCSRHPHLAHAVSRPRQFQEQVPCNKPCTHVLDCGHRCEELCHEPALHSRMRCGQRCDKPRPECSHLCTKKCSEPCGDCSQTVLIDSLPCGHTFAVQCADVDQEKERKCTVRLEPATLSCGHSIEKTCASKDEPALCKSQCQFIHECGHPCGGECYKCQENHFHSECVGVCAKQLPCGHVCPNKCHYGQCPPCEQPCIRSCDHGKICKKSCSDACDPCVEGCLKTSCAHGSCSTICSLPCGWLPCSKPCPVLLPCSHICPGLCGERCATVCPQCETGQVPQGAKMFLPCGHDFDAASLDAIFGLADLYELSGSGEIMSIKRSTNELSKATLQCPQCGIACNDLQRYRQLEQFKTAPETIERLYKLFGRKLAFFARKVQRDSRDLDDGFDWFCKNIELGPLAGENSAKIVKARMLYIMSTQNLITRFRGR